MRQLLEHHGWRVSVATTVREAIVALIHRLDWIVLDLLLPDGDGAAVLEFVRRRRLDTGVVVVTAVGDPGHLARVRALAPDALLQKPADINGLLEVIEQ